MKSTYFISVLFLCVISHVLSHPFMDNFMSSFSQSMANMQQNLKNTFNDPNFPGSPGWNANLKKSMSFLNDPYFPGNPGWHRQLQQKDPNFPGNSEWMANLKRETTLPTNCRKIDDVFGTDKHPLHPPTTIVYNGGPYVIFLPDLPATKSTYICNDPLFYNEPFLMLETQSALNNGYGITIFSAYALYTLQGRLFKQGNIVNSRHVGNNFTQF
ncbi:uncharacterized protein LOC142332570 isoform X2 [Lycorma delicatula]|uniref:uncharacterized protein LOC142332570 isoform X2 n=1 Tax=Lycorma delicatula TaxID=130591 RepID=UPI003F510DC0